MEIIKTRFEGLYVLQTDLFQDERGGFQKLFNYDFFQENRLDCDFREFYYSVNKKDVVRGMHFQMPPFDHAKLVYVSRGAIRDVVVDIRKNAGTYGMCFDLELNAQNGRFLFIPKGFAHGFLSLEEDTIVNYAQTSCYSREHDSGVDAASIGFDWGVAHPIRSGRDLTFEPFYRFHSPF
ncbi:MAG: dTDP-4-dehydrorhamnose 3,5-epimerase family protein [Bacteroidales bacterium]|nr:dTDP-4-dehydrorhamnose 3,5-epimerase family protein [Bacteroidales bacterium]